MIAKNKNKNLPLKLYSMFENIGGRCGAMRGNYTVWRRKIPLFYYSKNNGTEVRRETAVHLYEQLFIRKSINQNSVVFGTCSGEHLCQSLYLSSLVCVLVQTVVVGSKYTTVWKTVSSLSVYVCDNQCRGYTGWENSCLTACVFVR